MTIVIVMIIFIVFIMVYYHYHHVKFGRGCRWFVAVSFGEGVKVVCAVVM